MDIKYIGNVGPASGEGGGGSSFDPTAITGYDATKKQELFNENGTLKWKTVKIAYTNFLDSYNWIKANSACPDSYASMEQIIKVSLSYKRDNSQYSQCVSNSAEDNTMMGVGSYANQGSKLKMYDGSEHIGQTVVTEQLQTYWLRIIADGNKNSTLYSLIDNNGDYTIDTLPELSQFTEETSASNFTLAGKYFTIGINNIHNGTKMTIYEAKLLIDNVKVFDLQDPSGYKVNGNIIKLYWYE